MAIIFSKALSESELLNSHNSNTVEFNSDNVLTAVKCTLDFGSISFEITPNPSGLFQYDLKHATQELINENNFEDQIVPDIENDGYVYGDDTLYKLISLIYTIVFDNDSTESTTKNYLFTKSVKQPDRYSETIINSTDLLGLLIPFVDYSVKSYSATYHKGYPFDIAVYSNLPRTITIVNKTNALSNTFDLNQGVNRLFFSDGTMNFSFDDTIALITGINELEFQIASVPILTLLLNKKESNCGPYLKYYSNNGSYQYFLFNEIFNEDESTKIIDVLSSKFKSIEEATDLDRITGKESETIISMFTEYLTSNEMNYLKPIITSPRVELYTREVYTKAESNSWRGVVLRDATYRINSTKKELKGLNIEIGYTNNVMTL